jgi:hypothetical protein
MNNISELLSGIRGNAQKAHAILFELGLTSDDFASPVKSTRILQTIQHLMDVEDPSYIINKLTTGKPGLDKIDHLWSYFGIKSQLGEVEGQIKNMDKSIKEVESKFRDGSATEADKAYLASLAKGRADLDSRRETINSELTYF